jgi:hypothetical protein
VVRAYTCLLQSLSSAVLLGDQFLLYDRQTKSVHSIYYYLSKPQVHLLFFMILFCSTLYFLKMCYCKQCIYFVSSILSCCCDDRFSRVGCRVEVATPVTCFESGPRRGQAAAEESLYAHDGIPGVTGRRGGGWERLGRETRF